MANPDKRWVFKVSIHCEGCKRKVHKIIQNIEGVEKVDIDLKQHKVSVHGKVDPQTVIWKLEKSGKHAELFPQKEKPVNKESKKQGNDKNRDKKSSSQEEDRDQSVQENSKGEEKSAVKGEAGDREGRNADDGTNKGGKGSVDGKVSGDSEVEVTQKTVVENRAEAEEKATHGGGQSSTGANGGKVVDGNGLNRKKKNCQNGKKETSVCNKVPSDENDAAVPGGPDPNNGHANQGPPRHQRGQRPDHTAQSHGHYYAHRDYPPPPPPPPHPHPRHYYEPPVYAVNHHTERPASSYGASQYHALQPPMNSYHGYIHPRPEDYRPYHDPYRHQRPYESFQLFSDENPNACSLM